jgi:two-component system cell cycle response regulator CtrA
MDHLYGGRDEPVLKVLDIHVCRIRRKLACVGPGAALLRTIRGQGFVLGRPAAGRLAVAA